MLKKLLPFMLFLFVAYGHSQTLNTTGMLDTAKFRIFGVDTVKYSKGFPLSQYEDIRVILKANDTGTAGFKSDSLKVVWGYRTFSLCLSSARLAASYDTCFDQAVILDTLSTASMLKSGTFAVMDSTGQLYVNNGFTDTLSCLGWAIQSRSFRPNWDQYVQFWVKGITGNRLADKLNVECEVKRRVYVNVRSN